MTLVSALSPKRLLGVVFSDFECQPLVDALNASTEQGLSYEVKAVHLGAELPELPSDSPLDFVVVLTRPEWAVPLFSKVLGHEHVDPLEMLSQIDDYCMAARDKYAKVKAVFLPAWRLPPFLPGLGMLDTKTGGASMTISYMNMRVIENAERGIENGFALFAGSGHQGSAHTEIDPESYYLRQMAVSPASLVETAKDIATTCASVEGRNRKLLVLDPDDLLWGGSPGNAGAPVVLGAPDPRGEAFVGVQRIFASFLARGGRLAIASSSPSARVEEVLEGNPECVLRVDDFSVIAHSSSVTQTVHQISSQLGVHPSEMIWLSADAHSAEELSRTVPEVSAPRLPDDPLLLPSGLAEARWLDLPSAEYRAGRFALFKSERERGLALSVEDWIMSLETRLDFTPVEHKAEAASKLLNATRAMNLRSRRMKPEQLVEWSRQPGRWSAAVSVKDRLGSGGVVGVISFELNQGVAELVDFVLSCRVLSRRIEEAMLHYAAGRARQLGATRLEAPYLSTGLNELCLKFFREASHFQPENAGRFSYALDQPYPLPDGIEVASSSDSQAA